MDVDVDQATDDGLEAMSKPEFSRGKSKTFQPFNRAFSALYNALQLHSECAELKRD